jgi:hypothetical protein
MNDFAAFCIAAVKSIRLLYALHQLFIFNLYFLRAGLYLFLALRDQTCSSLEDSVSISLDLARWMGRRTVGKEIFDEPSSRLRFASLALRAAFLVSLLVAIARVSMPQSESLLTVFDAPADVVRLLLGIAACAWIAFQLFTVPNDSHAHRTWVRLGAVAVPFVLICIIAIW